MLKFLGILCFLLWMMIPAATPATAQNPMCPTRPLGDYTNACASTGFIGQMRSGNTNTLGTTIGTLTNGHCVSIDSSGNLIDAGAACTTGGGGGTVNAGTAPQFGYYASSGTAISGMALNSLLLGPNVHNMVAAGADPTGAADSSTAFQTVLTAVGTAGGVVYIPCGLYKVIGVTLNISATKSVGIYGGGPDCTVITSTTGATVLTVNRTDASATFHIRDFSVTTGASAAGDGIDVNGGGNSFSPNDFTNLTFRSSDSNTLGSFYFTNDINLHNVSNVAFTNVNMLGSTGFSGNGVQLSGDIPTTSYAIIFNFVNCNFDFMNVGLYYGSYVQGVQIVNTDFTGNVQGILVPPSASGSLFELVISSSQFNDTSTDIHAATLLNDVNIASSQFGPFGTRNNFNSIVGMFENASIVGNVFIDVGGGTSDTAIATASGSTVDIVTGNTFVGGWTTGVWFQSGTTNASVQSNIYNGPSFNTNPTSTTGSIIIGGGTP